MEISQYKDLFVSEARDIVDRMNHALVLLEKRPKDPERLNEIFREAHTLKGMAATMHYDGITDLTHEMEEVFDRIRQGKLPLKKAMLNHLFQNCDVLMGQIEQIASGVEPKTDAGAPEPANHEVQMVRVDVKRLDQLMNLVGELVIQKIRLAKLGEKIESKALAEALTQMGRVTDQLQAQMMQARLIPLHVLFSRLPRLVRDLAAAEQKKVDLVMEGGEIGLDRAVLDKINEPLTHLLRNSLSHGIESSGTIRLRARRERNFVSIEVSDDGRGMDPENIKKVAVQKGFLSEEEATLLTEEEIWMLITRPGFSTSRSVTQTSGRGVGMNAVRATVESIGGSLKIASALGKGSTFTLTLPLMLAIVQALLVKVSGETYAVPMVNILETLKAKTEAIKKIEHREVLSYRETVLPLIRFKEGPSGDRVPVVVVEIGPRRAGLVVDDLLTQQEVVIKSTPGRLKTLKGVAGATILENGRVAMVLDVASVLK